MALLSEREIKGLVIRMLEQSISLHMSVTEGQIRRVIAGLVEKNQFPQIPLQRTKSGVYSPVIARAFRSLRNTGEITGEGECRLTELGRLVSSNLNANLENKLKRFGVSASDLDADIHSLLSPAPTVQHRA